MVSPPPVCKSRWQAKHQPDHTDHAEGGFSQCEAYPLSPAKTHEMRYKHLMWLHR